MTEETETDSCTDDATDPVPTTATADDVDDKPSINFEGTLSGGWNAYALGEIDGELPDDYIHTRVDLGYLKTLVEAADVLGWEHVTLSLRSEAPVIIRNDNADDKPTLALAPRVGEDLSGGDA